MVSSVIGLLSLSRHSDRLSFYQDATTYDAVQTNLTVLGYLQHLQNGADLRSMYIADGSPNQIQGISSLKGENAQMSVVADAGGEGGVIMESAAAALQGMYPIFDDSLLLANGSTVTWSRVQLIPIESVEVQDSYYMEGYTGCNAWKTRLNKWYTSPDFLAQSQIANSFYKSISPLLGDRSATLENAWNIFDFLNVQSIHNASFAQLLQPGVLEQARYWANYHEAGSFSDPDHSNVGNIAGQAILPLLLDSLQTLSNTSTPLKMVNLFGAYKPFLSLFNLMDVTGFPSDSVVDYAATMLLEVHSDRTLRMLFRNGTVGNFEAYPLFGASAVSNVPLDEFTTKLQPYALGSDADWCSKCATTSSMHGCDILASLNGTSGSGGGGGKFAPITSTEGRHHVSPVVAGLIGSIITLALCGFLLVLSVLFLRRGSEKRATKRASSGSRVDRWAERREHQLGGGGETTAAPYELGHRASS
ncbi:hypothetical protein CF319_g191 [Tilletia indica]|nr:hypothetical protein CF319_g191 [Tilletia indica]